MPQVYYQSLYPEAYLLLTANCRLPTSARCQLRLDFGMAGFGDGIEVDGDKAEQQDRGAGRADKQPDGEERALGLHGRFLASMKARLPLVEVLAPGADNQTLQTFRPLQSLTTRDAAPRARRGRRCA